MCKIRDKYETKQKRVNFVKSSNGRNKIKLNVYQRCTKSTHGITALPPGRQKINFVKPH